MAYNYREAVKADVREWLANNEIPEDLGGYETKEEYLYDTLWVEDSVTGNGSGSYTCNREQAKIYVNTNGNLLLAIEAMREFGYSMEFFGGKIDGEEWEYLDVTIRCYLLGEAIAEALKEVE